MLRTVIQRALVAAFLTASCGFVAVADDEVDSREVDLVLVPYEPTLENGDWNGDGNRNVVDVIGMMQWLFAGGAPATPIACERAERQSFPSSVSGAESTPTVANGDLDASGAVNITDVIRFVNYLFLRGDEPADIVCDPDGVLEPK